MCNIRDKISSKASYSERDSAFLGIFVQILLIFMVNKYKMSHRHFNLRLQGISLLCCRKDAQINTDKTAKL